MGRPPCCDKANVKRGLWTPEEDAKILAYVANHGTGNWTLVPKKAGLNRCGKSCRLRWTNYLRPDLKHESFTPHEEDLIVELHKAIGSRWSLIAKRLPGRTDNDVKNYWNTKLKKKLMKMGIDPITHKPFSQIFSDYNNVTFLTHQPPQTRPTTRVLPSPFAFKAQPQPILSPGPTMQIFNHFHDHSIDLQAANPPLMTPSLFDELSPASSCSSSSSSMTNARQISGQSNNQVLAQPVPSTEIMNNQEDQNIMMQVVRPGEAEEAALEYDIFDGSGVGTEYKVGGVESETSSRCRGTSSFVKAILDRDIELQLDLLALNEFLDY